MSIETTHIFVMARGLGTRLMPLTQNTCKPCVVFGEHRLIDFVLYNLHKSGFSSHSITILGPPESSGLTHHLEKHWPLVNLDSLAPSKQLTGNAKSVLNALWRSLDNDAVHIGKCACDQVFDFDLRDSFQQYVQSHTNALFCKMASCKRGFANSDISSTKSICGQFIRKTKQIPDRYITNQKGSDQPRNVLV